MRDESTDGSNRRIRSAAGGSPGARPDPAPAQTLEIERRTRHEAVAERLRTMITEGALGPGVRLNERVLCQALRVSRTPLREAFKVLAAERLIELNPNRGASVIELSRTDVTDLFELMANLEGLSGRLAAQRRDEDDLNGLRALHAQMLAAHAQRDLPAYCAINRSIHEAINASARNAALAEVYTCVNKRIQNLRFRSDFDAVKWDQAVREHGVMLELMEAGDGERLRALLEAHLRNKYQAVLEHWPQTRPDKA